MMNKVYIISFIRNKYICVEITPVAAFKMMDWNSFVNLAIFASKTDAETYTNSCNNRPDPRD